jgi:N-acetylmuramoyl-L-alanine amidase
VLAAGDVLHVPEAEGQEQPYTAKSTNRYRAVVEMTQLRFRLRRGGAEVLANEPYRVTGMAQPIEGSSDGDGQVEIEVPAHQREIRLELPERGEVMAIGVGQLGPVEGRRGLRSRLTNLGYLVPMEMVHPIGAGAQSSEEIDQENAEALRDFQRDQGIEPTGDLDDDTRRALIDAHGG